MQRCIDLSQIGSTTSASGALMWKPALVAGFALNLKWNIEPFGRFVRIFLQTLKLYDVVFGD